MKKIDDNVSLVNYLKDMKKEGRKWDIILLKFLNEAAAVVVSIPLIWGFGKLTGLEINWAVSITTCVVIDTFTAIRLIIKGLRERENCVLEAEGEVKSLAHIINLIAEEDANNLVSKITFNGIKDAVTTVEKDEKEEYVPSSYGIEGHTKKTKTETTNFFLLDEEDKIRMLREIKKVIQENGNSKVDYELYLLDEEDIPSYVPVVKSLERK